MRELIRKLIFDTRRATRTEPAAQQQPATLVHCATDDSSSIGSRAAGLARVAAIMHMDQAAKLRAAMARANREIEEAST